jgi:xylan 1,4-beta-xylosidase
MKRRFALSLLLVPVFNVLYLIISSRAAGPITWNSFAARIQVEAVLVGFTLRAVSWGRYPTVVEMLRSASPLEYLLSALLCWLAAATLLFLVWSAGRYLIGLLPRRAKRVFVVLIGVACMVVVGVWVASRPLQPAPPEQAHIAIDLNAMLDPMPDHARGFSQGGESEMRQPGYFEQATMALQPIEPRFIRIDHLFDYYGVLQMDAGGQPTYNWTELDRIVDAILASGAQPVMCLSYLPPALAEGNVYAPPSDLGRWEELVYQMVRHFNVERQLGIRYWEVWNEPNVPSFWDGTLDDYLAMYEATIRGARRADSTILLGGPATASLEPGLDLSLPYFEQNWISELARFTQARDLPLDFVSWHYYDSQPGNYAWSVQQHQQWLANRSSTPHLLMTEWNLSSSYVPELDSEVTAAYAAATLTTLANTTLEQAFFFEPIDNSMSWEGRWGMMRKDGTPKPVYHTFSLVSQLEGKRMAVSSDHPEVGALAARQGDQINLLVWRYGQQPTPKFTTLIFTGLPDTGTLTVAIYGVDAEHGNPLRGSSASALLTESTVAPITSAGRWGMPISLPPNSVRLIKMTVHRGE